ncbi:hypothetical protein, partial [Acinetobacter baumannii]
GRRQLPRAGTACVLAAGVSEAKYTGVTVALAAINKSVTTHKTLDKAREDLSTATLAADILDSADSGARLKAVGSAFVFAKLGTD